MRDNQSVIDRFISEIQQVNTDAVLVLVLLVITWIVIDLVLLALPNIRENLGLNKDTEIFKTDDKNQVKNYISEIQGISGRPDAVILENGYFIPVERKPLAKTLHDRYKAQLLIYMRLIEEFEGKSPPYGYLVLGPTCKQIRINNSEENQAWVSGLLKEMQEIAKGAKAIASPHPRKCSKCSVKDHCYAVKRSSQPPTDHI